MYIENTGQPQQTYIEFGPMRFNLWKTIRRQPEFTKTYEFGRDTWLVLNVDSKAESTSLLLYGTREYQAKGKY